MQFGRAFVSSILIGSLLSCQQAGGKKSNDNANNGNAGTAPVSQQPPVASQAPAVAAPAKLLLGRARTSVIGMPMSKPEFVELESGITITSGQQAAQLYATGRPVDITRAPQATTQLSNSDEGMMSLSGGYPPSYSSGYNIDWNWVLGGLIILGGAALIYYSPIGSYDYGGYQYSPYGQAPGYPQPQPYPGYPAQP